MMYSSEYSLSMMPRYEVRYTTIVFQRLLSYLLWHLFSQKRQSMKEAIREALDKVRNFHTQQHLHFEYIEKTKNQYTIGRSFRRCMTV